MKVYVRKQNGAWWVVSALDAYFGVKAVGWWKFLTWAAAMAEASRLAGGEHPVAFPTYFEGRWAA